MKKYLLKSGVYVHYSTVKEPMAQRSDWTIRKTTKDAVYTNDDILWSHWYNFQTPVARTVSRVLIPWEFRNGAWITFCVNRYGDKSISYIIAPTSAIEIYD